MPDHIEAPTGECREVLDTRRSMRLDSKIAETQGTFSEVRTLVDVCGYELDREQRQNLHLLSVEIEAWLNGYAREAAE